jgi:hypothetical protein
MENKKSDILKKAILQLPEFVCNNAELWEKIEFQLQTIENDIDRSLSDKLPEYKAPEGIWENIERSLDEKTYENALNNLPEYSLPTDIWKGIDKELSSSKPYKTRWINYPLFRVAAVIALLIGGTLIIKELITNNKNRDTISYSVETIDDSGFTGYETEQVIPDNEHIQVLCENNPVACSTEQFIELTKQIDDVNKELQEMVEIIQKNKDPQMLRYYYRLENQKVEIEQKMIKIINQS